MERIGNLFTPVPKNQKSHVRGWALHWADLLDFEPSSIMSKDDPFDNVSTLYFEHGVNISPGQLNLFGGLDDNLAERVVEVVLNPGIEIVSLDYTMDEMGYVENLRKRTGQKTCSKLVSGVLLDELDRMLAAATHLTQVDMFQGSVTIGDSHTIAYAPAGSVVERRNGLTLFGATKKGEFTELLKPYELLGIEKVTLVAGSIDIRHHVGRQIDPETTVAEIVDAYVSEAERISGEHLCEVELCVPVPVEYEGRKIPKTGFYKDAPFTGTRDQRADWTALFAERLKASWQNVVQPPEQWYTMDPEAYAQTHMELSSSVHIAPSSYRRTLGWDV
jgi:hypothetical protein